MNLFHKIFPFITSLPFNPWRAPSGAEPSYSAVVLDEVSHQRLVTFALEELSRDGGAEEACRNWEIIAHHMTICLGELPPKRKSLLGTRHTLIVTHLGRSEQVMAVKVATDVWTVNRIPHVTLAINPSRGGQARMSNDIPEPWQPLQPGELPCREIQGVVQEIPAQPPRRKERVAAS